jgi:hypothetical protein
LSQNHCTCCFECFQVWCCAHRPGPLCLTSYVWALKRPRN